MQEALVRYVHFLGIFALVATLAVENLLIAREMHASALRRLARVDGLYGLSAFVTLVAGMALWLVVGKPSAFYSSNPLFHTKLFLFGLMAVLSLVPTQFFLRNRRREGSAIAVPAYVVLIKRIEALFLVAIPLLAVLMAQGIGNN